MSQGEVLDGIAFLPVRLHVATGSEGEPVVIAKDGRERTLGLRLTPKVAELLVMELLRHASASGTGSVPEFPRGVHDLSASAPSCGQIGVALTSDHDVVLWLRFGSVHLPVVFPASHLRPVIAALSELEQSLASGSSARQ